MSIVYLTYRQIDKQKWEDCIKNSVNRLIYAQSFYLDAMAENWDALVLNDYEAVMPLTWKKKWGIKYLYQPAFIQQGGVFFTTELSAGTLQAFTDMAFSHFKFAEITFNYLNECSDIHKGQVSLRNNYVLPLNKSYNEIYTGYPSLTIKNLNRAKNLNLHFSAGTDYLSVLKLYEKLYSKRLPSFTQKDYYKFSLVCKKLSEENNLVIRNVTSPENELLAAAVLLVDNNRLYNVISCITKKGKTAQANYFLYDRLIHELCSSDYLLDFEGSDIKGIADFYSRFNPCNERYPFCKINNLHPFIKLLKR